MNILSYYQNLYKPNTLPPPPPHRNTQNKSVVFGSDKPTIDFYDRVGSKQREDIVFDQTIKQRERFLKNIPTFYNKNPCDINILDAGCGTGRDTRFFTENGYNVDAFDASYEMTKRASSYTGVEVLCDDFLTFSTDKKYDGIYARNSLLHVPKNKFKKSVENMVSHLKPDGILWATLKAGRGESYDKKGRFFSYYNVNEIKNQLNNINNVSLVNIEQYENEAVKNDSPIIEFIIRKN